MIKSIIQWLVGDECLMRPREKKPGKLSARQYRKGLNKNDPFDQLIMELGQQGVLDVCMVEVTQDTPYPDSPESPRKPALSRWRHPL